MTVWILFLVLEAGKQLVDEYPTEQECYDALMGIAIGHAMAGHTVAAAYCEEFSVVSHSLNSIEQ